MKQFLCDLSKGSALCHFAKVVLLGDQCASKSSLVDSLVLSRPPRTLPTTALLTLTCAAGGSAEAKGSSRTRSWW